MLNEKVLIHLDIEEINLLFKLYPETFIRKVWEENLLIQEPWYHGLNRFLTWFYFRIDNPDKYIISKSRSLQNERLG